MIEEIDWALRYIAAGVCWGGLPVLLSGKLNHKKVSLAFLGFLTPLVLFSFSKEAHLLSLENLAIDIAIYVIHAAHPIAVFWAMLELFDPTFRLRPSHLVFVVITIAAYTADFFHVFRGSPSLIVIFVHGYLIHRANVLNSMDNDPVRRRFRSWFLLCLGFMFILLTIIRLAYLGHGSAEKPLFYYLIQGPMIIFFAIILYRWILEPAAAVLETKNSHHPFPYEASRTKDKVCMTEINAAMDNGVWRTDGLTIKKLSEILDLPEYRIRKTINNDLGFRNFASFLNEYRIREACRMLTDPESNSRPILSIAFDLGYASIGPFNRAFKDIMGVTPSTYRKRHISE